MDASELIGLLQANPFLSAVAVTAVIIAFLVLRTVATIMRMDKHLSRIPSPSGALPILGHVLGLATAQPWFVMAKWCEEAGNIVTFNVVNQRVVYVNDPKLIKRVLLTNQRNYNKDTATSYKHFMCLLGKGLVTSEGEKWRKGRLLLSHALRIDILEEIPEITHRAISKLLAKMKSGPVDLNEEFRHMTLQVIGEAALSLTPEETDAIFPALYLPIVHECNKRVWEPWRQFMPWLSGSRERSSCLEKLNAVLCDAIRARWALREKEAKEHIVRKQDIMDLCMSQIPALDDSIVAQLRDDVKTMLLAGHETSAALLTWATYELMANPRAMEEVAKESVAVYGAHIKAGTIPTLAEVKKLRWTPAVLREALRKHSVVPVTMRLAMADDVISAEDTGLGHDITIPKGCTVAVGIQGVHLRPDIWPNPNAFIPERFMDENADRIDPYSFIPFINGPRNCLGQHLSLMETQFALSWLVANMSLSLHGETDIVKVGRHHDYIVPAVPHDGLNVLGATRAL